MEDQIISESVFVAHSPYHCLLGFAIARCQGGRNYLFLDNMFDRTNAEILVDFLEQTDAFDEVILFEGKFTYGRKKSGREIRFSILKNIRRAKRFLQKRSIDNVYTTIDNKEFDQAVMHFCTSWSNADCIHIEDGAVSYSSETTGWCAFGGEKRNKFIFRLLFGFWWENVAVYGQSKFIDRVRATHPEYIRSELQELPTEQISEAPLYDLAGTEPLTEYFAAFDLSMDDLIPLDGVFILPHSNLIRRNPEYKGTIKQLFNFFSAVDAKVGVKYHPRDDNQKKVPDAVEYDLFRIASDVPIELVYITNRDISFVVGDVSTSLITAKWLLDNVTAYSFGPLLSGPIDGNQALLNTYRQIGIETVSEIDSLTKSCSVL